MEALRSSKLTIERWSIGLQQLCGFFSTWSRLGDQSILYIGQCVMLWQNSWRDSILQALENAMLNARYMPHSEFYVGELF